MSDYHVPFFVDYSDIILSFNKAYSKERAKRIELKHLIKSAEVFVLGLFILIRILAINA